MPLASHREDRARIERGRCQRLAVGCRRDDRPAGRGGRGEELVRLGDRDREPEQRPHGGADHLGRIRVDPAPPEHDPGGPKGFRGPDQRPGVSGIPDPGEQEHGSGSGEQLWERGAGLPSHRQQPGRGLDVGEPGQDAVGELVRRDPAALDLGDEVGPGGQRGGSPVELLEDQAAAEGLAEQGLSLQDERSPFSPRLGVPELANAFDARVVRAERGRHPAVVHGGLWAALPEKARGERCTHR